MLLLFDLTASFEHMSLRHDALLNLLVFQVCSNFGFGRIPNILEFVDK